MSQNNQKQKPLNIETTQPANAGTKHFVRNIDESLFQKLIKYRDHSILNEKELKLRKHGLRKLWDFAANEIHIETKYSTISSVILMMQEPDESELTVVRVKENFRFGPNAFPTLEYSYAKTTP